MNQYNPGKQYKWEETDEFVMNGALFGLILNACKKHLATETAQETLLFHRAETEMTKILIKGIESGMVKELLPDLPIKEKTLSKI